MYPPGGYGYFLNYVMTHYFNETIKIDKTKNLFDSVGTTHNQLKYTNPVWISNIKNYQLTISVPYSCDEKILLLLEGNNGNDKIENHNIYNRLSQKFPNAQIVKSFIDPPAIPVFHLTSLKKTKYQFDHKKFKNVWEDPSADYAIREHWTLWYHSNPFNFDATYKDNFINIPLSNLITSPVKTLLELAKKLNLSITNINELQLFCRNWQKSQLDYFKILSTERRIKKCIENNINLDISNITDLHTQGYINYCIERDFNVIIPVYDYRNWFKSTNEIKEMVQCLK